MSEIPKIESLDQLVDTPDESDSTNEEYPEYNPEKARKLRDEHNKENNTLDNNNEVNNKEHLMLEQQLDDMSVLLSICDEKDAMDILHSDTYGILLENQVSLMDLFNADALFDEQYFSDGYTNDGWRYNYDGFLGDYDADTKIGRKKNERKWESEKIVYERGWLEGKGDYDAAQEYYSKKNEADEARARDTKETMQSIFEEYFSDYGDEEEAESLRAFFI